MRLITKYFRSSILVLGVLSVIYGGILPINHIEANDIDVIDENADIEKRTLTILTW